LYGVCDGAGEVALLPAEPLDDRGPERLHKKSESVTLMRPRPLLSMFVVICVRAPRARGCPSMQSA
jgi:hypothetical protein